MRRIADLSTNELRQLVRNAGQPDHPGLIRAYLERLLPIEAPIDVQRRQFRTQFDLLLDTFSDVCLPVHWRIQCLDAINIPLTALNKLAICTDSQGSIRQMQSELRITSNYFAPTLFINP
jgi:hypothetical protein